MAGEISGPPAVNFYAMLSGIGDTIAANRKEAARREAFAAATAPGADGTIDYGKAILGLAQVDPQAAALLAQRQNHMDSLKQQERDFAFRREESARAQRNADRSYGLQERQFRENQDYSPEERAAMAAKYGVDPNSQQGKTFALTGKLPEGDTSLVAAYTQRKAIAEANGLKPDNPGYQSFILTGKMPREDAQPLTAGDKEAIRTADDAVLSNQSAIESLNRAKSLSSKAFSGPAAATRGYAASFLGESSDIGKGGIATENLTNEVMTNALGQLKAIFGGNPTEGERKILLELQGSVNKPDNVRQSIFDRAIAVAKKKLEFNQQRAEELRGGTYYKNKPTAQPATSPSGPVDWRTYFGGQQ